MPEPLWRGRTPDLGDCCSCPLLDNGDRFPPGTEVVVLTAAHYGALLDEARELLAAVQGETFTDADHVTEAALRLHALVGTPLADVIAELGLTQEEIDGADDG